MTTSDAAPREIPAEVQAHLDAWAGKRGLHIFLHYSVGAVGIFASVAAAVDLLSRWDALWLVISLSCFAFLLFGNPLREYGKFARAVRVLNSAVLRYRYGIIERAELLEAMDRGESIIENSENDDALVVDRAAKA